MKRIEMLANALIRDRKEPDKVLLYAQDILGELGRMQAEIDEYNQTMFPTATGTTEAIAHTLETIALEYWVHGNAPAEQELQVGDYCECCDPDTIWCKNR